MTPLEIKVLNYIANHGSIERPIKAYRLREHFGLNKRQLEKVIENLRMKHFQPIVAIKRQPSGYFLPKTDEEREAALKTTVSQIKTEMEVVASIRAVNLAEYWS